jgi:hypothetical protein
MAPAMHDDNPSCSTSFVKSATRNSVDFRNNNNGKVDCHLAKCLQWKVGFTALPIPKILFRSPFLNQQSFKLLFSLYCYSSTCYDLALQNRNLFAGRHLVSFERLSIVYPLDFQNYKNAPV